MSGPNGNADLDALVQAQACQGGKNKKCLIKKPIPWTQIVYLLILVIVGTSLLGVYWSYLKGVGIWLIIVIIVVLAVTLVVAVAGIFGGCLVYRTPPPS
jgi:hypothetical protein